MKNCNNNRSNIFIIYLFIYDANYIITLKEKITNKLDNNNVNKNNNNVFMCTGSIIYPLF
jgi:hypothetical protein